MNVQRDLLLLVTFGRSRDPGCRTTGNVCAGADPGQRAWRRIGSGFLRRVASRQPAVVHSAGLGSRSGNEPVAGKGHRRQRLRLAGRGLQKIRFCNLGLLRSSRRRASFRWPASPSPAPPTPAGPSPCRICSSTPPCRCCSSRIKS